MKRRATSLTAILASSLISAAAMAESPSPAEKPPHQDPPSASPAKANPDMSLIQPALEALSKAGDKEAVAAMEKARKNGGKLEITQEQAAKMIQRALDQGLIKPGSNNENRVGEALKALIAAGDPEAVAAGEKARKNAGKLEITPEQAREFVARAIEKGLIPETPAAANDDEAKLLGRAQEAIQALAAAGDPEAAAELKKAQDSGGKLAIDKAKVIELVKRALGKGLIKDTPAGSEAEMSAQVARAIQALAVAGDSEAAEVMERARRSGGKLQVSQEKGHELVKRAKEKGLID